MELELQPRKMQFCFLFHMIQGLSLSNLDPKTDYPVDFFDFLQTSKAILGWKRRVFGPQRVKAAE
jgi:hypothetical protein